MNTCISAIQHLRPLRGGAQSHLLRASDGACYVTKFQNNPQHVRVLANEKLATNLGLTLGLPMPRVEVIEVSDWLIEQTEDLRISLGGAKIPCRNGKQLGSLYVGCESPAMTLDYLPRELLEGVRNLSDFARVLVLDKWTCNSDGRQAIFWKAMRRQRYSATFIDQGYCFNGGEWSFPDYPLRGVYANNCVYEGVTGWEAFEPSLTKAEEMDLDTIWRCAAEIPEEWYEGDRDGLERLVETLCHRRTAIRRLIGEFRRSSRNPFPNWRESPANSAMPLLRQPIDRLRHSVVVEPPPQSTAFGQSTRERRISIVENHPPVPADSPRPPLIPLPIALYVSGELIFELYDGGQPRRRFAIRWDRFVPTKENEPEAESLQTVLRTRQD